MKKTPVVEFRLYIAGEASNSRMAKLNLENLCRKYLPDQHSIEVVDVTKNPRAALQDSVFLTPTLVRLSPKPPLRIVGNLSDEQALLSLLGMEPAPL